MEKLKQQLPDSWLILAFLGYLALAMGAIAMGQIWGILAIAGLSASVVLVYLAVYQLSIFYLVLLALLPWSVKVENLLGSVGLSLPGELLLAGIGGLALLNFLRGGFLQSAVYQHPVSLWLLAYMLWLTITTLTSTMLLVSAKFWLIQLLFLLVFYLVAADLLRRPADLRQAAWAYGLSVLGVIVYALVQHSEYNFHQQASKVAVDPFFRDHTMYGATLAFLLPVIGGLALLSRRLKGQLPRMVIIGASGLLLVGVLFSYSRAAWLSVLVLTAALAYLQLRFRLRYALLSLSGLLILVGIYQSSLRTQMRGNEATRSSDFGKHLRSTTNITTSVSNKERLNRWFCAFRMTADKPVLGFGPGTYMFQYGPYQMPQDLTRISSYHGERGGAHSEYLKVLTESGLPGLFTWLGAIITAIISGTRVVYNAASRDLRWMATLVIAGLVGYLAHGVVNNFSHTAKIAVLLWGAVAFLVAMDTRLRPYYQTLKAEGRYRQPL